MSEIGCGAKTVGIESEFAKFAGQCQSEPGCSFYTFSLSDTRVNTTNYYGLIKDTNTGRQQGVISAMDGGNFMMFVVPIEFPVKE